MKDLSRRRFLRSTAALGLGAALAPLLKVAGAVPTPEEVKAAAPAIPEVHPLPGVAVGSGGEYLDITNFGSVDRTYLIRRRD
jgi:hypothetical protein